MSRKDFQAIADVIRESDHFALQSKRAGFAAEMADALAADNPRFDRVRFLTACQPRWTIGAQGKHSNPWFSVIRGEAVR